MKRLKTVVYRVAGEAEVIVDSPDDGIPDDKMGGYAVGMAQRGEVIFRPPREQFIAIWKESEVIEPKGPTVFVMPVKDSDKKPGNLN